MIKNLDNVHQQLTPLIQKIRRHPIYEEIKSIRDLRIFMENHVFAVWDFMCLLKALQGRLVSWQPPWFPPQDAYSAHWVNRILVEEEGDLTEDGLHYRSHFEIYLTAMQKIGANIQPIQFFLCRLREGEAIDAAMVSAQLPHLVKKFVKTTFDFFEQDVHALAAAFVYGREAITPSLFTPIVYQLEKKFHPKERESLSTLIYYLKRHIELDDGSHFPQALKMLQALAGEDAKKWQEVENSSRYALKARLDFLTAIQAVIKQRNELRCY